MPIVKGFLSAIGLTLSFRPAARQVGVWVRPLSILNSPSDKSVKCFHIRGINVGNHLSASFLFITGLILEVDRAVNIIFNVCGLEGERCLLC